MSALPRTSRAAVLVDYNQPLEIRELAVPPPALSAPSCMALSGLAG